MNIPVILKELTKVGVVALTEESVKSFVETKIKPIFENWGREESRSNELEECLSEYLLRCYGKNNIMTTIVFGRMQKTLEDLYIPLTLEEYRNKDKKWVIDEKCYDILDNYSRILIVDMAGMGKSTIVKYFACQGVNLEKCIPIVIELRRLGKNQSIIKYIQTQINSLDKNIEVEEVVNILKKGDFVIFFDGYDEITNENKSDVLDAIQEFASKATNTKIVITSREEDDLNSLGEYKCVNIKPLIEEEAYKLIEKYDNDGDLSKKLIKRLKEDSSMDVLREFLENPLLVSLLYKTFEYKEEIPYSKIQFYEQVYEALFNDHDKTKGSAYVHEKKSRLDKYQFEQILRTFGFLCLKTDKLEYSSQLIYQLLDQSIKRFSWLKIKIDDFLHDITHAVPFIQKDGNEYRWVHKSFMEYFASCFICYDNKENEEKYLKKIVSLDKSNEYYNILDFCYEMDTLGFRKHVILPYLERCMDKYEKSFTNNYFKQIGNINLHWAKQIAALIEDIKMIRYDITSKEGENKFKTWISRFTDIGRSVGAYYDTTHVFALTYTFNNYLVYRVIINKIPELFKCVTIKRNKLPNFQCDIEFCFNDDIYNPIYADKSSFSKIIKNLSCIIFSDVRNREEIYYGIDKEVCKRIIEEIKIEETFQKNSIFDL